jgi:L-seryl-tRNA(Ser) seleniumtransferase
VPDFRVIPSIEQLRQRAGVIALEQAHGHAATTAALRRAADALRREIAAAAAAPADQEAAAHWIESAAGAGLVSDFRGSLRPTINATGVVIHTNLGRAPLARAALERLNTVAQGYCNLEYDLEAGHRGSRMTHAERLLTSLTGAEAALVVNNNAAATMLILAGLAYGREVVISRGELVEIGGGFRVPDVMAQSGAVLREVGTTNRTRIADYSAAVGPNTALILRVHPSNFRIEGFTERPSLESLVATARAAHVPLVEDLGSGCLGDFVEDEPTVQSSIDAGADLVCFSGDKLLGGPQAGVIAGRASLVGQLRQHPLLRALRVDKLTLAALEGTLIEYLAGRARETVPVLQMIGLSADALEDRARALAERITASGWSVSLVGSASAIGGGSAPGVDLPTVLVAIHRDGWSADRIESDLRRLEPPVIARIEADMVVLDLRTVDPADDERLARLLATIGNEADSGSPA